MLFLDFVPSLFLLLICLFLSVFLSFLFSCSLIISWYFVLSSSPLSVPSLCISVVLFPAFLLRFFPSLYFFLYSQQLNANVRQTLAFWPKQLKQPNLLGHGLSIGVLGTASPGRLKTRQTTGWARGRFHVHSMLPDGKIGGILSAHVQKSLD